MVNDKHPIDIVSHNNIQLDYYNNTHKKAMTPTESLYVSGHINKFIEYGKISNSEKLLEVGCGVGKYTLNLLGKGYQIDGLDLSSYLLKELARFNKNKYPIKLYNTDILNAPDLIADKYDAVIGFMVLHHLHDLTLSFQSASKMLKDDGRLVFLEPNAWNPLYYFQITFTPGMTWKSEKGVLKMRRKVLVKSLSNSGFNRVEILRFGFFPPFIKNTKFGNRLEKALDKLTFLDFFRPFQIVVATRK